jgi:predicted nucleotidyltransferase
MEPPILLSAQDWQEVCRILRTQTPGVEVWAFGSRAKGTAKPYSDLDLALITTQPLSLTALADINTAFEASDLPIRVDIVDWATTSDAFRAIIARDKVVVQGAGSP